jgi:alcohol dehydrogenase
MSAVRALVQRLKKATFPAAVAALVLAAYLKSCHKNATLACILKRYLGKMLLKVLPIPVPRTVTGVGSIAQVGAIIKELECKNPLIVADEMLVKLGVVKKCTDSLDKAELQHKLFDKVVPNPVSESVEEGYQLYKSSGCDGIIAIGGGSPMDVAKAIGARVATPKTPVLDLSGLGKVDAKGFPPFVAVPTTAGTGSEATIVAVITNVKDQKKVFIGEACLVPKVAVLDPELLAKLPKPVTAATGMDALTHAIESYIGGWTTPFTKTKSTSAVVGIFNSLVTSYNDGANMNARQTMLQASFDAGVAFTRANVGYVHAIAHQFGGLFHTPHGDANAMLLPHVLSFYIRAEECSTAVPCCERLCELAKLTGVVSDYDRSADAMRSVAKKFVERIVKMNQQMHIPTEVAKMKASDLKTVVDRALTEAHGTSKVGMEYIFDFGFPVPYYMTPADCEAVVAMCLPAAEKKQFL